MLIIIIIYLIYQKKSYNSLTNKPTLGTASSKNTGTASGNIPILGADGKLNDVLIPKIAISETSVVNSETLMLALTAETGDIAIRTDVNKSFILKNPPASTLANWQELITPMSPVQSVAGKTGTVVLDKGDVGLSDVDNTSDINKPVSTAQSTAIGLKADKTYVDGKVKTDVPLGAKFTDTIVDISNKVDKETGKGLISTAEVTRLSTVTNQVVPTKLSELSNDQGFITGETIEDLGGGDMLKSTYDTNAKPGYVDKAIDSDTVNGKTVGVNVPANALFTDTIVDISGKADKSQVLTNVPCQRKVH